MYATLDSVLHRYLNERTGLRRYGPEMGEVNRRADEPSQAETNRKDNEPKH